MIFMVTEMMMKMIANTQSMKIGVCKVPFCEKVLQIRGITHPKTKC